MAAHAKKKKTSGNKKIRSAGGVWPPVHTKSSRFITCFKKLLMAEKWPSKQPAAMAIEQAIAITGFLLLIVRNNGQIPAVNPANVKNKDQQLFDFVWHLVQGHPVTGANAVTVQLKGVWPGPPPPGKPPGQNYAHWDVVVALGMMLNQAYGGGGSDNALPVGNP